MKEGRVHTCLLLQLYQHAVCKSRRVQLPCSDAAVTDSAVKMDVAILNMEIAIN